MPPSCTGLGQADSHTSRHHNQYSIYADFICIKLLSKGRGDLAGVIHGEVLVLPRRRCKAHFSMSPPFLCLPVPICSIGVETPELLVHRKKRGMTLIEGGSSVPDPCVIQCHREDPMGYEMSRSLEKPDTIQIWELIRCYSLLPNPGNADDAWSIAGAQEICCVNEPWVTLRCPS